MLPRLVPVEDEEVSKELARVFRKRGINFHTSAKVDKVEKTKVRRRRHHHRRRQAAEDRRREDSDRRRPQAAHRKTSASKPRNIKPDRGFIKTDSWMQTSEPGVYAVGDIVLGTPQLAHVGAMEGIVAVTKIAGKPGKPINPEHIPGATYCHPEIGSVGLTETKAREAGYNVKIGKFPFTANSRASHRRPARRLHQNCLRRRLRRDSGRAHHRPPSDRTDRRSGRRHGTGSHSRRFNVDDPRPPHAGGSHAGCVEQRLRNGHQRMNFLSTDNTDEHGSTQIKKTHCHPERVFSAKDLCNSSVSSVMKAFDFDPHKSVAIGI